MEALVIDAALTKTPTTIIDERSTYHASGKPPRSCLRKFPHLIPQGWAPRPSWTPLVTPAAPQGGSLGHGYRSNETRQWQQGCLKDAVATGTAGPKTSSHPSAMRLLRKFPHPTTRHLAFWIDRSKRSRNARSCEKPPGAPGDTKCRAPGAPAPGTPGTPAVDALGEAAEVPPGVPGAPVPGSAAAEGAIAIAIAAPVPITVVRILFIAFSFL